MREKLIRISMFRFKGLPRKLAFDTTSNQVRSIVTRKALGTMTARFFSAFTHPKSFNLHGLSVLIAERISLSLAPHTQPLTAVKAMEGAQG